MARKQTQRPQKKKSSSLALPATVAVVAVAFLIWVLMRPKTPEQAAPVPAPPPVAAAPQEWQPQIPVSVATASEAEVAAVPRMTVEELNRRLDANAAVVIDVRDIQTYAASHIPGALHIPLAYIHGELPYLPRGQPIVTYCT